MRNLRKICKNAALMLLSFSFFASAGFAKEKALHVGNGAEPRELDPGRATGSTESDIIRQLFEGLIELHPISLDPIPGQAESWTVSEDAKTYVFKLRKGLKWSDGMPVTAHDYVYSWRRVVDPNTASEYAYIMYVLKNGEIIGTGKEKDLTKLGVKAVDDLTLQVDLEEPVAYFAHLAAFYTYLPVPKHVVSKMDATEWYKPKNIVVNGPYKLKEWELNKHIKLVKNPLYREADKVSVQEVYFHPVENQDTEERMFRTGQLDMTNEVPIIKVPNYIRQKKKTEGYHPYQNTPGLAFYYYEFNTKKAPFDNPKVRQALSLAIDRKLLVERVTRRGEKPAVNFVPPGAGGYPIRNLISESADLEKAKSLLAEAGYKDGKNWPKDVNILYNTSENHKRVAVAIQQMWKDALKIDIKLYNQEWKVYLNTRQQGNFDVARAGWIGDYPDPNSFIGLFTSTSGQNNTGWGPKKFDDLVNEANRTTDQAKRFELFSKAEDLLYEEMPLIPIYYYSYSKLVAEHVKIFDPTSKSTVDFKANPQDSLFVKYIRLAKK